jgi:hypothetical protein
MRYGRMDYSLELLELRTVATRTLPDGFVLEFGVGALRPLSSGWGECLCLGPRLLLREIAH